MIKSMEDIHSMVGEMAPTLFSKENYIAIIVSESTYRLILSEMHNFRRIDVNYVYNGRMELTITMAIGELRVLARNNIDDDDLIIVSADYSEHPYKEYKDCHINNLIEATILRGEYEQDTANWRSTPQDI